MIATEDLEIGKMYVFDSRRFGNHTGVDGAWQIRNIRGDKKYGGARGKLDVGDLVVLLATNIFNDDRSEGERRLDIIGRIRILQNKTGFIGWINFVLSEWSRANNRS